MDEDDLADLRNRKIGFVFQSFNLVPRTSALINVELPLAYAGVTPPRTDRAEARTPSVGMAEPHEPPADRAVRRPAAARRDARAL